MAARRLASSSFGRMHAIAMACVSAVRLLSTYHVHVHVRHNLTSIRQRRRTCRGLLCRAPSQYPSMHGTMTPTIDDWPQLLPAACWLLPRCFYPARSPVLGFLQHTLARAASSPAGPPATCVVPGSFLYMWFVSASPNQSRVVCYQTHRVKSDPTILYQYLFI